MQEFNQFQWHSENETVRPHAPAPQPEETPKKSVSRKTVFLSALAGCLVGALSVAFLLPFTMRQSGTPAGGFRFAETGGEKPAVTQVTYNPENRKELSTVDIGKLVGPAVVGISTIVETQSFSFFGYSAPSQTEGSGSGIIITEDGYIVTNNHVIEGAKSIKVILNNAKEYDAKIVGSDSKTDLAVLKIEEKGLPTAHFGNSDLLEAGERCVAIGNPLGQELAGSLTQGIISALNRTLTVDNIKYTLIQTDAAINPGNSGGALVNAYGEVIGINTVKVSSSQIEGLGFAIPVNNAKPIIEDLMNHGYVKGRPQIGITLIYVNEQEANYYNIPAAGLFVSDVSSGSGAAAAGIQKGDVILKCNGEEVKSSEQINAIRDTFKAGDTITLTINRDGAVQDVKVTLSEEKPTLAQ